MRKNAISSSSDDASRPKGRSSISGTRRKGGPGRGAQRRPHDAPAKPRSTPPDEAPLNAGVLTQPGRDLTEFGKQLTFRRDITVEDIRDHPGPAVQKISPAISNP